MERNILFQDTRTVQKNNAISSCTYSGNAAFQTYLLPQTHPMLIQLYILEYIKIFKSTKYLQTDCCYPKIKLLTKRRNGVSVMTSGSKCCDHARFSYQNHIAHYKKSPILQNTHICYRWLISRNISYACLATVRLSQLMQIFCCHSCHTGIITVWTKSPPFRTQPCPKAVGFPRALTWSG